MSKLWNELIKNEITKTLTVTQQLITPHLRDIVQKQAPWTLKSTFLLPRSY